MNKILIVEDEASLMTVLVEKFKANGFSVIKARNGAEGYESATKNHPDMILLDIIMPVMDGITMLKKLRQNSWGKNAKVILLTNLSDSGRVKKSLAEGVHDYLIKSDWTLDDIVKKVNKDLDIPQTKT